jgi:hypothetical protein
MKEIKEKHIKIPVKQKSASFAPALKYKVVSDEELKFTKAKAFEFLELKTFEGERSVRENHVQFLFDEWAAGRFLWQNIILASAKVEGTDEHYRINGQHTCWMRVNVAERYEPLDANCRIMVYSVPTMEQLRSLYSAFDRGAPRTVGHISRVLLMGGKSVEGFRPSLINQLMAGFKIFFAPDGWKRQHMAVNEWCGMIENNYSTMFNIVGRYLANHADDAKYVKRAAVTAAMFATFEKNVQASDEFWAPVFHGIGLEKKTDPRWQLRRYLDTHGHNIKGSNIKVSQEEMYCVCVQLWNHWRDETEVSTVKPSTTRQKAKA